MANSHPLDWVRKNQQMYIVEMFTYDEVSGLRFRIEEKTQDLDSAHKLVFVTKLSSTLAGWKIYHLQKHEDYLVASGWDRGARKNWACGKESTGG